MAGVGTNRYAYSGNDPINAADPGGNGFWSDLGDSLRDTWDNIKDSFSVDRDTRRSARDYNYAHQGGGFDGSYGDWKEGYEQHTFGADIHLSTKGLNPLTYVRRAGVYALQRYITRNVARSFAKKRFRERALRKLFGDPVSLMKGRRAGEVAEIIAERFKSQGFSAKIRISRRGSGKSISIDLNYKGKSTGGRMFTIDQIRIHPGGGQHKAGYLHISTSFGGIRFVRNGYRRLTSRYLVYELGID